MSRLATLDLEKTEASINLHKAAPDLLAVCADLVESAEYWGEYDVPIGIVDRLNAAIAKAGGTALRTPESCHWQKGDWLWDTGCGQCFDLQPILDGMPADTTPFCPYCAHPISRGDAPDTAPGPYPAE